MLYAIHDAKFDRLPMYLYKETVIVGKVSFVVNFN